MVEIDKKRQASLWRFCPATRCCPWKGHCRGSPAARCNCIRFSWCWTAQFPAVLLQILAQNMTDQPMKSVCLRITCRDAAGTVLQEFPAVLLKNIYAAPHGTFHNRQNLYLPTGTASCDLLPERVFFQDGQVWDPARLSAGPITAASHACRPRRIGRRRTAAGCPAGGLSQRLLLRRA